MDERSQQRIIALIVMLKNADHKPRVQKANVTTSLDVKSKKNYGEEPCGVAIFDDFQLMEGWSLPFLPSVLSLRGLQLHSKSIHILRQHNSFINHHLQNTFQLINLQQGRLKWKLVKDKVKHCTKRKIPRLLSTHLEGAFPAAKIQWNSLNLENAFIISSVKLYSFPSGKSHP